MRLLPSSPVLTRGPGAVQVGLASPVVLDGLTPAQERFLGTLDGGRSVGPSEARRHRALLEALATGRQTSPEAPERAPARVRVHSGSALACEAGTVLARCGWAVGFVDPAPARRHHLTGAQIAPGSSRGTAAAHSVRSRVPGAEVRGPDAEVDLDILVSVGLPVLASRRLLSADRPHLIVATDEHGATVGPLVTPGTGPCCTCLGLWAAESDPEWPIVALQCESREPRCDPLVAGLAGMLAASAAQSFASGRPPRTWRVDAYGARPVDAPPQHPACACSGQFSATTLRT
ncbi:hypothetical protein [Demequina sp. NBRC 110056]|uniref:hypothetical protein n=1 Tax=Demequina sp. NBRC 110056 TaxID=1570345 RepID=UPI00117DF178|nr:hypothetical protein [Demequina sp. NBRC 110056]